MSAQTLSVKHLQYLDNMAEKQGELTGIYAVYFFKPYSGKWKYIDYLVLKKPDNYGMYFHTDMIKQGLRETPQEIRETSINSIEHWTVVAPNNPLGYPIMVVGRE